MADQTSTTAGSASGTDPVRVTSQAEDGHRSHSNRERSIGVVVLLDYLAGILCALTAGIYLTLKVLNERIFPDHPQNLVFRLLVETQRFARVVGLAGVPGLAEDRSLLNFTNRSFTDSFLAAMVVVHLAASAVCLGLGYAVTRRRLWALWTQAVLATLALLLIVAYAVAYAVTVAPRAGLVAIAGAAIVPAWAAYVFMFPAVASVFTAPDRDVTDRAPPRRPPIPFLVRFMLGGIFVLWVVGCLAALFWIAVPTAILLRRLTI
jgi:hypothetical protein